MRNVWKGLIIGAFTGAATGLVLDVLEGGARHVSSSLEAASKAVPDVSERLREGVRDGVTELTQKVHDAELPQRVEDAAGWTRDRAVASAENGAVNDAVTAARHQAGDVLMAAKGAADRGRKRVAQA